MKPHSESAAQNHTDSTDLHTCGDSAPAAQGQDERIVLTAEERARFVAYLRQDAAQEAGLVEFLADLPGGTNGARIRTDCKIRRDVKLALAEELERGR